MRTMNYCTHIITLPTALRQAFLLPDPVCYHLPHLWGVSTDHLLFLLTVPQWRLFQLTVWASEADSLQGHAHLSLRPGICCCCPWFRPNCLWSSVSACQQSTFPSPLQDRQEKPCRAPVRHEFIWMWVGAPRHGGAGSCLWTPGRAQTSGMASPAFIFPLLELDFPLGRMMIATICFLLCGL